MHDNPEKAAVLRRKNPLYVFFQELKGDGPVGYQGAVLTAERSLAVDHSFIPLGAPLWLEAKDNTARLRSSASSSRRTPATASPARCEAISTGAAARSGRPRQRFLCRRALLGDAAAQRRDAYGGGAELARLAPPRKPAPERVAIKVDLRIKVYYVGKIDFRFSMKRFVSRGYR